MEILIYIVMAVAILALIGFILGSVEHGGPREFNDYLKEEEKQKEQRIAQEKDNAYQEDLQELMEEENTKEIKYEKERTFHIDKQKIRKEGINFLHLEENSKRNFYYLRIIHKGKPYYKIGITKFTVKERYENWTEESITYNYDILFESRAKNAKRFEKCLIDMYKPTYLPLLGTKGNEIYSHDILRLDTNFATEEYDKYSEYEDVGDGVYYNHEDGEHYHIEDIHDEDGNSGRFDEAGLPDKNGNYDEAGDYKYFDDEDDKYCIDYGEEFHLSDSYEEEPEVYSDGEEEYLYFESERSQTLLSQPYWVNDFNNWSINNQYFSPFIGFSTSNTNYQPPTDKINLQSIRKLYSGSCSDLPVSLKYLYYLSEIVLGSQGKYLSPRLKDIQGNIRILKIENSNIKKLPEWLEKNFSSVADSDGFLKLHTLDLSKAPNIDFSDSITKRVIENLINRHVDIIYP